MLKLLINLHTIIRISWNIFHASCFVVLVSQCNYLVVDFDVIVLIYKTRVTFVIITFMVCLIVVSRFCDLQTTCREGLMQVCNVNVL